ncbi:MAG: alanine racemase [Pseudomonadota bacterium]
MATGTLTVDLGALAQNWRALDALSASDTAACVKADAYGLGIAPVVSALSAAGCTTFCVAVAEEGAAIRATLGPAPRILVFGGHMAGDAAAIARDGLTPMLNSPEQVARHRAACPDAPFGIQLDSGMNRLGMEAAEWADVRASLGDTKPALVMSHLACADEQSHHMNAQQLATFRALTDDYDAPRSLAATGGILLGAPYHFDLTRPGIGLYGGAPFTEAAPVVRVSLPVIQVRDLAAGETVGYGNIWRAERATKIATVSGGYADGLIRAVGRAAMLYADGMPCPLVGRVSMDLITVDVTDLPQVPDVLDIICPEQGVDVLATSAGTIGYEILTSLGARYQRRYVGA